jgi:hypothetical protein
MVATTGAEISSAGSVAVSSVLLTKDVGRYWDV